MQVSYLFYILFVCFHSFQLLAKGFFIGFYGMLICDLYQESFKILMWRDLQKFHRGTRIPLIQMSFKGVHEIVLPSLLYYIMDVVSWLSYALLCFYCTVLDKLL